MIKKALWWEKRLRLTCKTEADCIHEMKNTYIHSQLATLSVWECKKKKKSRLISLFRVLKSKAKRFMNTLCGNTDQLDMRKSYCVSFTVKVASGQGVCVCVAGRRGFRKIQLLLEALMTWHKHTNRTHTLSWWLYYISDDKILYTEVMFSNPKTKPNHHTNLLISVDLKQNMPIEQKKKKNPKNNTFS